MVRINPNAPPSAVQEQHEQGGEPIPTESALRVIVCHPEYLIGQAIAATLLGSGVAHDVLVVTTPSELLTRLGAELDVAIVSEAFGEELHELLDALAFRHSTVPVLGLSVEGDYRVAALTLEWGAMGSIDRAGPVHDLCKGVVAAARGTVVLLGGRVDLIGSALLERREERAAAQAILGRLSSREHRVLGAMSDGLAPAEIARSMNLSPHTIRATIRGAGAKLDVRGQLRIAARAREIFAAARPPSPRFLRNWPQIRESLRAADVRAV